MSEQNRTLQPTAKRRQLARAEGRVAVSSHVTAAAVWLSVGAVLCLLGTAGMAEMKDVLSSIWKAPWSSEEWNVAFGAGRLREAAFCAGRLVLPVASICVAAAVVGRFAQVGCLWAPRRLTPRAQRLRPTDRLQQLFSVQTPLALVRDLGLAIAALLLLTWGGWSERASIVQLAAAPSETFEQILLKLLGTWTCQLGLCLAVFAALDYAYQRYRYEVSLRMSPEELRAEIQAVEGNPHVAAGQRGLQRQVRGRASPG